MNRPIHKFVFSRFQRFLRANLPGVALVSVSFLLAEGPNLLGDATNAVPSSNTVSVIVTNGPAESNTNLPVEEELLDAAEDLPPAASSRQTNALSPQSFAFFKIISDRNIFNLNRSARSSSRDRNSTRTRPSQVDSFALVGTLSSDKGQFAFFNGSGFDYRKVLKTNDTIAGYKLAQINSSGVKLESKGKEIILDMGMQMRRRDEGPWEVSTQTESYASEKSSSETNGSDTIHSSLSGGAASDVLKRLMEKREKELTK